jgi:hypothetical protein
MGGNGEAADEKHQSSGQKAHKKRFEYFIIEPPFWNPFVSIVFVEVTSRGV